MKILYVHYALGAGGAERLLVDLANRMAMDSENDVSLLTVCDINIPGKDHFLSELSDNIKFLNLHRFKGISLANMIDVWKIVVSEKPDIVHAHCSFWLVTLPAIFYRKSHYVTTIHSLVQRWASGKLNHVISKFLFKGKVQAVTISKACHQSYVDYYHLDNDVTIDNGREDVKRTERLSEVSHFIDSLKTYPDTPIFIHVARHHPVKNHERMFKTFGRLTDEGIDYQLIVVGDKYDDYIDKYKDHPNIHLVGKKDNVGDYMSLADYFVLTSDKEGLPITLLEAMSLGVIPVCTPAGGVVDVINDGDNGYMASDVDDEMYYQTVKRALAERGKISRDHIIEDFKEKYSMKICADKYFKVYKDLL